MSNEKTLSPMEQGLLVALTAIAASLRSTPGFDGDGLTKAAQYFIDNPPPDCMSGNAFSAYEWPLTILKADVSQLQNMLNEGKVRN
ncbi:hypothetical protein [Pseudomonas aeruginosa]|uniref:hypothetical protein n=1 Tax=Pseudomonas aeruginosa group TaxID=136841 RepID=UPI000EB4F430|nr:hypothetical protein [Pseudomonas aeruginosa]EKY0759507.1 hypothetical protein [Pseudomonas aeruginosa]EKZ3175681.1 hypothetical protein [Pseudomonas aeruginosa]MBA4913831.1 hypothetical protein [Pseudomonas aeruginosa]MBG4759229.1 hypothetical protein [Pseudomonas aeruginosa]MBV6329628.1 hypothetical protein [Pseudomonas aeruginosa]